MNKIALLGALALSACASLANAQDTLRIGIEAAYPPFAFKTPDGQISGFDYDIGNALCAEMQVKCEWVEQAFDGLIPSLKVRKVDAVLSSMSITPDRLKAVDFTKSTTTPRQAGDEGRHRGQDPLVDLKGKRVGVQRRPTIATRATNSRTRASKWCATARRTKPSSTWPPAASMPLADVVNIGEGFLKTPEGKDFALVGPDFNDPKYFGNGAGIAVRKGDKATAEKFSNAIAALRENGKYKEVQDKYFAYDIYGQ